MIDPAFLGSTRRASGLIELSTSGVLNTGGGITGSATVGTDWGDGVAFGARPVRSTTLVLSGASNQTIENLDFNSYLNPDSPFIYDSSAAGNAHVCIRLLNCTNITIRNVDFHNVSEPIEIYGGSGHVVEYCRVDGITGPGERVNEQTGNFVQTHGYPTNIRIRYNKVKCMNLDFDPWGGVHELGTEDIVSFFSASDSICEYNQFDATGYVRDYGTGTILGDGSGDDNIIRYNTYLNPGQVGIAVAGGHRNQLIGNTIWRDSGQHPGSGNTAAYYWDYDSAGMSGGYVADNRAYFQGGGGFWNPGPPPAVTSNNNWNDPSISRASCVVTL